MGSNKTPHNIHPWNLCIQQGGIHTNIQLSGTSKMEVQHRVVRQIPGVQILSCERATARDTKEQYSPTASAVPVYKICNKCFSRLAKQGEDKCELCVPVMCLACKADLATRGELCHECDDALQEHPTT